MITIIYAIRKWIYLITVRDSIVGRAKVVARITVWGKYLQESLYLATDRIARSKFVILIIVGVGLVNLTCTVDCGSKKKIELVQGVYSKLTENEARALPNLRNCKWIVKVDTNFAPQNSSMQFHMLKILIFNYEDLGVKGQLKIEFLNDRLMSTWFFPKEVDAYIDKLRFARGIKIIKENKKVKSNGCQILYYKDYKNNYYIRYDDCQVLKKYNNLIWYYD